MLTDEEVEEEKTSSSDNEDGEEESLEKPLKSLRGFELLEVLGNDPRAKFVFIRAMYKGYCWLLNFMLIETKLPPRKKTGLI